MADSIILGTPVLLIITLIALFLSIISLVVHNKFVCDILSLIVFLCVICNVIYALMLGVKLGELLCFILVFAFVGMLSFVVSANSHVESYDNKISDEVHLDNCNEQVGLSEKNDDQMSGGREENEL